MNIFNSKLVILYKCWALFIIAILFNSITIYMQSCTLILTVFLNKQHIKFLFLLCNTDSNLHWLFRQIYFYSISKSKTTYLHSIKTRWSLKKKENIIKKDGLQTLTLSEIFRHQICQYKYTNSNNKRENISTKYISHKHNGGGSNNISYAHILIPLALGVQITKSWKHLQQHCLALPVMFNPHCVESGSLKHIATYRMIRESGCYKYSVSASNSHYKVMNPHKRLIFD
jgi:hypothetical protein